MPSRFDPIAFVEAAYRLDLDEPRWIAELVRTARPGFDQGLGVGASCWRIVPGGIEVGSVFGEMDDDLLALVPRTYEGLPLSLIARHFSGPAQVLRLSDDPDSIRFALSRIAAAGHARRVRDVVGAQVGTGRGDGLSFGAFAPRRARFEGPRRRTWLRLMAHAGAALRLRARLTRAALAPAAVIEPGGRVAHAEGELVGHAPRAALVRAVRAIERARGPLRASPEEALSTWRALVGGTWSVVDWIDVDGRRFLVAYENPLAIDDPRALTPRERVVLEYVVHGRSSSEIAYALGIGAAAVDALARTALRKLGRARRTDLAAILGAPVAHRVDEGVVALGAGGSDGSEWGRLTEAERAVVSMALEGQSNDDIARARGRSVHTVANQLARVYRALGVRGRTELAALLGPPPRERGAR